MLLPLILVPILSGLAGSHAMLAPEPEPPVRIALNSDGQYLPGERAKVKIETRDNGYLLVLHFDTEGRLRVLFPVEPNDDNSIRGGHKYEIQGRGGRESFLVGNTGEGLIYSAISADPFRFEGFVSNGHWDYGRVSIERHSPDPEKEVTELVQQMGSSRGFDYDVASYAVSRDGYNAGYRRPYPRRRYGYGYGMSSYGCNPWSYFSCYDDFGLGYGYSGYGYGGYGYPYGGFYDPYFGGFFGFGGIGRYPGFRNGPVLVGRPRGSRAFVANGNYRFGSSLANGLGSRSDSRNVPARRSGGEVRGGRGGGEGGWGGRASRGGGGGSGGSARSGGGSRGGGGRSRHR